MNRDRDESTLDPNDDAENPAPGDDDDEEFYDPDDGEMPAEAFPPLDEDDPDEVPDPHDLGDSQDQDLFVPDDGDEKPEKKKRRRRGRRSSASLKDEHKPNAEEETPMGGGIRCAEALVPLLVSIDDIQGDPSNPRLTRRLDVLKGAFSRFGIRKPIVVNRKNNTIEAGHQSVAALKELGATKVPVVWVDDDETEQMAFNIADNRTGEVVADWDEDALAQMLEDLDDSDALDGLGFNDRELDDLLGAVSNDEKSADELLGDDFVLPEGDIEDKTAMDKVTLFVVIDKKRDLLRALEGVRQEIGADLVRIMK